MFCRLAISQEGERLRGVNEGRYGGLHKCISLLGVGVCV